MIGKALRSFAIDMPLVMPGHVLDFLGRLHMVDRRNVSEIDKRPPDLERRTSYPMNVNGNGNGVTHLLPIWMRAIATLGVPSAIAIFLVWVGSNEVPKIQRQTQVNTEALVQLQEHTRQIQETNAAIYRMLQRLCSNTAKTDDERSRCFEK